VRGVRLHYVEEGEGNPLVFLHGNAGIAIGVSY
jgi:pimeloyl-ACP methyl ester carboxylesterase